MVGANRWLWSGVDLSGVVDVYVFLKSFVETSRGNATRRAKIKIECLDFWNYFLWANYGKVG